MAVDIRDIRVWAVRKGVSCVVAAQVTAGTFTACGTLLVGDWRRKTRTKRVCAACRERLNDASMTGDVADDTAEARS